jgi:hypothetical protein
MSRTRKDAALIALRLVLGLVVLAQSLIFLFGDTYAGGACLVLAHGLCGSNFLTPGARPI